MIEALYLECCDLIEEYQAKVKAGIVPDVYLNSIPTDKKQESLHKTAFSESSSLRSR